MSIHRWMHKGVVVHTHTGILLSHERKHICINSNEVDEPRAYYIEWNMSEREKQILYINAYIWNLERWYWWTYLQGSNGDADIMNRLVDLGGEGGEGTHWKRSIETDTSPDVRIDSQWGCAIWCSKLKSSLLQQTRGGGWTGRWEGGSGQSGQIYTYDWFMLVYGRNQHNVVKQSSSN